MPVSFYLQNRDAITGWRYGDCWVKKNGIWYKSVVWVKTGGVWKRTISGTVATPTVVSAEPVAPTYTNSRYTLACASPPKVTIYVSYNKTTWVACDALNQIVRNNAQTKYAYASASGYNDSAMLTFT